MSAAAQFMKYAGLDVYTYCQDYLYEDWERPASGCNYCKVTFTKAGSLKDPQASSDALMAVRPMNRAELANHNRIGIYSTQTPQNQGLWDEVEGL